MGWMPDPEKPVAYGGTSLNTVTWLDDPSVRDGIIVTEIQGLYDHPSFRVENRVRPSKHGSRAGDFRLGARAVTIEGIVWGSGYADLEARKLLVNDLFVPDGESRLLTWEHPSEGAMQASARVEMELVWGSPYEFGPAGPQIGQNFQVGLVAHDPRRYTQAETELATDTISTLGGLFFPLEFPITFGATGIGGTVAIPAGGNYERSATIEIYGPAVNPIVEVVGNESAANVTFDGLTVGDADVLTLDLDEQTATIQEADSTRYRAVVDGSAIAYWRLGEDVGATTAVDRVGGYNGTIGGGVTMGAPGALLLDPDTAASFATSNVQVAYDAGLSTLTTWTVEGWVYVTGGLGTRRTIYSDLDATRGLWLGANTTNRFRVEVGDGVGISGIDGTTTIVVDTWYHVAASYDGSTVRLYVNGTLENSAADAYTPQTASNPIRIGQDNTGASGYMAGRLDEVAVYAEQLTDAQIDYRAELGTKDVQPALNVYGVLDFDVTRWFQLSAAATTLRFRGSSVVDPAQMIVYYRDASV